MREIDLFWDCLEGGEGIIEIRVSDVPNEEDLRVVNIGEWGIYFHLTQNSFAYTGYARYDKSRDPNPSLPPKEIIELARLVLDLAEKMFPYRKKSLQLPLF